MKRITTTAVATLALLAGGAAVTTTVAQAAPVQKCSGSIVSGTGANRGVLPIDNRLGEEIGRVELYYDPANGRNCAMTRSYLGRSVGMVAQLNIERGASLRVSGSWRVYSDGAELYAPGRCVSFSGSISGGSIDSGSASRGFGNCR